MNCCSLNAVGDENNSKFCNYRLNSIIFISSATIITLLAVGILAICNVGLFSSLFNTLALGASSIALAGVTGMILSAYIASKCSKKSISKPLSILGEGEHKGIANISKILKIADWETLGIKIVEGNNLTVQEYESSLDGEVDIDEPTLLLLKKENTHCALKIPIQIVVSDEKSMLVLLIYEKITGQGERIYYRVNISSKKEYIGYIEKQFQYNWHEYAAQEELFQFINLLLTSKKASFESRHYQIK